MLRKFLKIVTVSADLVGRVTFANRSTDTGAVRVAFTDRADGITLVALAPRPGGEPKYPTGAGYRVKFPVITVPRAIAWRLAQFDAVLAIDPEQSPSTVTSLRARLHDGTTEYHWTGAAWVAITAADTDWNTLAEVSANLPSWDPDLPLGLVFELQTTDRRFAPTLRGFRLLYEVDLPSELNDWVYGALVGGLQDTFRPVKDILTEDHAGGASFDFGALVVATLESPWDFRDVVAVYDEAGDPSHRVNLLDSYDSGTKVATLTGSIAAGTRLLLRVQYAPQIAVTTDPDYIELGATPAVTFEAIDVIDLGEAGADDQIVDEFADPPTAVIFPARRRAHIDFSVGISSPLSVDLHRMSEELTRWFQARRVISSPTTGDEVTLRIVDPLAPPAAVSRMGERSGTMSFRLENVYFNHRDAIESGSGVPGSEFAFGVKRVQVTASVGSASVPFTVT